MAKKKQKIPLPVLPAGISLVDTHCHLDMIKTGEDIEKIIARAAACGIKHIITIGIDMKSSRKAVAIAEKNHGVFAAIGIHPHNAEGLSDSTYNDLEKLCEHEKVVAFGEIGLDYVKKYAPQHDQLVHYARQVELAKKMNLPLVIHDREAHDEILQVLTTQGPFDSSGVMHCFSGDWQLATKVLDLGFLISIPGVVTFPKASALHEVARKVPLDKLILETDAPFLAPVPNRGKTNLPEFMLFTAGKIAAIRGISLEEVAHATTENAKSLFHIDTHYSLAEPLR